MFFTIRDAVPGSAYTMVHNALPCNNSLIGLL